MRSIWCPVSCGSYRVIHIAPSLVCVILLYSL
nr:MAG TPA: hypothetical protein [Caudoviricetes sp.]